MKLAGGLARVGATWLFRAALLSSLAACGSAADGTSTDGTTLTIAAASSLRDLLSESRDAFESEVSGVRLSFSFEASSTLARQIRGGAGFDAFVSADRRTVERCADRVDGASVVRVLANRLALVVRPGLDPAPRSPTELARGTGTLALAGPEVPAGRYARAFLADAELLVAFEGRITSARNVRAALALVESGAADAALVYVTDAARARRGHAVWNEPSGGEPIVEYVAAVLDGPRSESARRFTNWLGSPTFLRAAERHGFEGPRP